MLRTVRNRCSVSDPYNITCREADEYRDCLRVVAGHYCGLEVGFHAHKLYKFRFETRVPVNCQSEYCIDSAITASLA
ncbi:hypothetical protein ElyMa_002494800 [Elysia marginata]|uniref:Uncharacterized protein n=1 Tax=Elysia marginata TaxID=1093978 RepID=A0AAV4GQF7_9GAST|nr:hypothetical protein ElyMa_002494800 [Elysia marginata]